MDLKKFGLGVALIPLAFSVSATPQNINTLAPDSLALDQGAGYYIWNSEDSPSDWRIRWRANDLAADSIVKWFGSLEFRNATLDGGSVQKISFETGSYTDILSPDPDSPDFSGVAPSPFTGVQALEWFAYTDNQGGYDGFNFSLEGYTELLALSLGSSLFGTTDADYYQVISNNNDAQALPAQGIFVGENYLAPDALVMTRNGRTYQEFEILVPEPGTLALLGLGLSGLVVARRRRPA